MSVLVLTDSARGNAAQAIALAKLLGLEYEEKKLQYNLLAELPFFLGDGFRVLKRQCAVELCGLDPSIVISSGRRAANVALAFKRKNPACKVVQILKPQNPFAKFDIIILPEHDKKRQYPKNVIFSKGALSIITKEELEKAARKWNGLISEYQAPYTAVLVGGNSRKCSFSDQHIDEFVSLLVEFTHNKPSTLLITTSRRTPAMLAEHLKNELKMANIPNIFYEPSEVSENPYFAFLAYASAIIATGDSISMCSEACSISKPLYVYVRPDMVSKKHLSFLSSLFDQKLAAPLEIPHLALNCVEGGNLNSDVVLKVKSALSLI